MVLKKDYVLAFILSIVLCLLSVTYYGYFSEAIDLGDWENIKGFTRVLVPDTFVYLYAIDPSDPFYSLWTSSVKNTIGPSLMWFIAGGSWELISFCNSCLLFIGLIYFIKIARLFGVSNNKRMILVFIIALLPSTIYYSVGALKEIPTLMFIMGFSYHYIKNQRAKWLLFVVLMVLFRYQLVYAILLFLFVERFKTRSLLVALLTLGAIAFFYPYLKTIVVFSSGATINYRLESVDVNSLGGMIESVRETMPGFSLIAVSIRVFQSIFEPILTFVQDPSYLEKNGHLSLFSVMYLVSNIVMFPFWLLLLMRTIFLLKNPLKLPWNVYKLYTLCIVVIVPIGGFSFIHHRYLYLITPILLLLSVIPPYKGENTSKANDVHVKTYA